nr:hypothetical protein [uncultured Campylobacter sp.]
MLHADEAKKANREALKKLIKLVNDAQNIDKQVRAAQIAFENASEKLKNLLQKQDEIDEQLRKLSPDRPDITDTDDEPTENYSQPHPFS